MFGSASAITVDGDLADWGITDNDLLVVGNQAAGSPVIGKSGDVFYWEEDSTTYKVGPAYGGENFDIEGLYYTAGGSSAFVAAVIGYEPGKMVSGEYYGDVFITTTTGLYAVTTYAHDGLDAGALYDVTGVRAATVAPSSSPAQVTAGTLIANGADFTYAQAGWFATDSDWIIELSIDVSKLSGTITSVHLTETCGNDSATMSVPEPASMALLGGGLLVLAMVGRRRFK